MKKYIVTVYAICKNEEKFVDRWFNSMSEADNIVVLDTGSTDNSVEKLKSKGAIVKQTVINPWRFDVARNESLKLVPMNTDICVCTDLDEVFESGWRKKLEDSWQSDVTQLKYTYVWNHLATGENGITFLAEKIHAFNCFSWKNPVHEILDYSGDKNQRVVTNKNIILKHYADNTKSRSQYLPLLELSVKENPYDDRNMHYLGREYMFYKKYPQAIKTLKQHLALKTAVWREERSASCQFIGNCFMALKKYSAAEKYYKKAIEECSTTREPFLTLAMFYYVKQDYVSCLLAVNSLLNITQKNLTYMTNPDCWNALPYDLQSFCYYKLSNFEMAKKSAEIALKLAPNDKRLNLNLQYYNAKLQKQ